MDEPPSKPVGHWFARRRLLYDYTTRQAAKPLNDISKPSDFWAPPRTTGNSRRRLPVNLGIRPGPDTPNFADLKYATLENAVDDPPMVATDDQLAKAGQVSAKRMPRIRLIEQYENLLENFGHHIRP